MSRSIRVHIHGLAGSGKTTLLHILKTEIERLGGKVLVAGEDSMTKERLSILDKPADYRPGDMEGTTVAISTVTR